MARYGARGRRGGDNRWRNRLVGLLALAVAGFAAWFLFSVHTVRGGIDDVFKGRTVEAAEGARRTRRLKLLPGGAAEIEALLALESHDYGAAGAAFDEADRSLLRLSGLTGRWSDFSGAYLDRGDYRAMELLCRYIGRRGVEGDELQFNLGCALCGVNELEEARRVLAALDRPGISPFGEAAQRLIELSESKDRRGRFAAILDRNGIPLAELELASGRLTALEEGVTPLLGTGEDDPWGLEGVLDGLARNNVTVLTIDGDLQRAAQQALDGRNGAIVVLDPLTGDLLALVGQGDGGGARVALGRHYEPASVIKLITLASALREGPLDRFDLFPFRCDGNTAIEGRVFYDWRAHGRIPHVEHAMAVSCNLVFARVGLLLGKARLVQELEHFGFGGRLEGGLLPMELGSFQGDPQSTWDLARLSVGLDFLTSTPLHLALMASAVADEGEMMKPRLLLRRENILGRTIAETAPESLGRAMEADVAAALTDAMFEVVESTEGTGRRAAIDGLDLAMKTGTGGDRRHGLDAVVVGFAPAHQPRVAFAVVLEGGGKAELAAARAARALLEAVLYKLELLRGDPPS